MALTIDLAGQVALVTGGGTGLGQVAARALAEAGATVVIAGRRADVLGNAAAVIGAEAMVADITEPADVDALFAGIVEKHGRLDILVNAAGRNLRGPSTEFSLDDWDRVHAINSRALFHCCQAAGRIMLPAGRGRIVNIASLASEIGLPLITAYASSKGSVRQITKALAVEWAKGGVRVNGIEPGWFRTELNAHLFDDPAWVSRVMGRIPMGRAGNPDELAGAVLFLASQLSEYVTGELLVVDGGALSA